MLLTILVALGLSLAACGLPSKPQARVTNFDSVVLSNDLWVGDDARVVDDFQAADAVITGSMTAQTGVVTDTLAVAGVSAGYITATQSITSPDLTLSDDLTVSGLASIGEFGRFVAQSVHACADSTPITATGTYQPISATANLTSCTLATTGFTAGDVLVLTNVVTWTIGISDTGTTMLNADRELGQYDTLVTLFDGTNWLELSFTNN
jgi:hypothetical protein